jgi:hypothetical protein
MDRVLTVVVTGAVLLAGIAGGAAGVATAATGSEVTRQQQVDRPVITVEARINQTPDRPGHVRLTYTVTVPDNVREVQITLPEAYADERERVTTSEFKQTRGGSNPRYTAFSPSGTTRSLTIEATLPTERPAPDDRTFGFDTGSWAYFSNLYRTVEWTYADDTTPPRLVFNATYDQSGFDTGSAAFVGEYTEYTHQDAGQQFHLIVPNGVDPEASRATIFETLTATAQRMPVGERDSDVYVVPLALGEDASEGGFLGQAGDRVMWVTAQDPGTGPSIYIHEYVHTRQTFTGAESSLQWYVEGSAQYLQYAIPLARGNGSVSNAETSFAGDASAPLTKPEAWPSFGYQYDRGALAVALLNKQIIEATDGQQSVRVVFRGLNERAADASRPLTGGDLRAVIRQETPVDANSWYRSYVDGTGDIDIESPWAFVITPKGDPDADGVRNAREYQVGSHPFRSDTDGDGLDDGSELDAGTDPTKADTDGDGLRDRTEIERGLDPTKVDTDGDGTPDGEERTPTPTAVATTTASDASATTDASTATPSGAQTSGSGPLPAWIPLVAILSFGVAVARHTTR